MKGCSRNKMQQRTYAARGMHKKLRIIIENKGIAVKARQQCFREKKNIQNSTGTGTYECHESVFSKDKTKTDVTTMQQENLTSQRYTGK